MITNCAVSPEFAKLRSDSSLSSTPTATADRLGADTHFLYGLLWGLVAATLIAGAVAVGLAAALVSGQLQP